MRRITLFILVLALPPCLAVPAAGGSGVRLSAAEGWSTDLEEARTTARRAKKDILILVNGSTWSEFSSKFYYEVLKEYGFLKWVDRCFVPAEIDVPKGYPRKELGGFLFEMSVSRDKIPMLIMEFWDGAEYAVMTYDGGGAESFADNAKLHYGRREIFNEMTREVEKATGDAEKLVEAARLVRKAAEWGLPASWKPYARMMMALDADNAAGLKLEGAARLAASELERGDYAAAGAVLDEAAEYETAKEFILYTRARTCLYLGRYDDALACLRKLWEIFPANYQASYDRLELLSRLGKYKEMEKAFTAMKESLNSPYHLNQLKTRYMDQLKEIKSMVKAEKRRAKKDVRLPQVKVETVRGTFFIDLFYDSAPNTVEGFHCVKGGDMAIAGDRLTRDDNPYNDGFGPPPHYLKNELLKDYTRRFPLRYYVGMLPAKSTEKYLSGSYFCITLVDRPDLYQKGKILFFGKVTEGKEIVDGIVKGDEIMKMTVSRELRERGSRGPVKELDPERISR